MGKLFATVYDAAMRPLERGPFQEIRTDLLQRAEGEVLEVGSGSGINFPYYNQVETVIAIEPNEYMSEKSLKNKKAAGVPIEIIAASAEKLPFSDNTFDTVVATLVLCTIPNVPLALQEIKRVCKPNGKILLFEHVKMDQQMLAKMQDLLTPIWKKVCDGCHLNRDTVAVLQNSGLEIVELKRYFRGLFVMMELKNNS